MQQSDAIKVQQKFSLAEKKYTHTHKHISNIYIKLHESNIKIANRRKISCSEFKKRKRELAKVREKNIDL